MASEAKAKQMGKPLRQVSPSLYRRFITEVEAFHIHPYDFKVSAIEEKTGLMLSVSFGEDLTQEKTAFFSFSMIERMDQAISDFFVECGEMCKQVLIADYYKMMKP